MLIRRYYDLTKESILHIIGVYPENSVCLKYSSISIMLLIASTVVIPTITAQPSSAQLPVQKEKTVLTAIFVQLDNSRQMGKLLLDRALTKLKLMYPKLDIQLNYLEYPSNEIRSHILKALNHPANASGSVDLISFDQIWLGEFLHRKDF